MIKYKRHLLKHRDFPMLSKSLFRKLSRCVNDAIRRCTDPSNEYYCQRGINVYNTWMQDRKAFLLYICNLPGSGELELELDRIDNTKGYEPGNLQFSTHGENMRHTSRSRSSTLWYTT